MGAQGKVGSYIIINLQIWDVSRRYQLALSLTNQNKQLYLPNHIVFLVFTHASRSYALRSTEKINQIYLWVGASAGRQAAAPFGRKPACFRRFRPPASHTRGAGRRSGPSTGCFCRIGGSGLCPSYAYVPFYAPLADNFGSVNRA